MREVYADTGYWIGLANPGDVLHAAAMEASRDFRGCVLLTSEAVLWEFLNWAGKLPGLREAAARKVRSILAHPRTEVVSFSHAAFLDALALYEARLDKTYSLTDSLSMEIMEDRGIQDVLTADQHFAQTGSTVLLR